MLYIVATPIGNLDDMTERGLSVLRDVDVIACEDTRRTRILLSNFKIPRPSVMVSYREGNEMKAGARLIGLLVEGRNVALCTDGGYPGISDPGYRLIRQAVEFLRGRHEALAVDFEAIRPETHLALPRLAHRTDRRGAFDQGHALVIDPHRGRRAGPEHYHDAVPIVSGQLERPPEFLVELELPVGRLERIAAFGGL